MLLIKRSCHKSDVKPQDNEHSQKDGQNSVNDITSSTISTIHYGEPSEWWTENTDFVKAIYGVGIKRRRITHTIWTYVCILYPPISKTIASIYPTHQPLMLYSHKMHTILKCTWYRATLFLPNNYQKCINGSWLRIIQKLPILSDYFCRLSCFIISLYD